MKKSMCIAAFLIVSIAIISCKKENDQKIITPEVTFTKEGELTLYSIQDSITKTSKVLDIEIADNDYQIQTGLMYRKSMENNKGMLFVFPENAPRAFYMKNTEFSLDIIYIDDRYKIVSVQKNAKPLDQTSLPSDKPAKYVLEINGGLFDYNSSRY